MSRGKVIATTIFLLSLLGLCFYVNRGCFSSEQVMVYHRYDSRPGAGMMRGRASAAAPLIFGFSRPLRLTAVQVLIAADAMTNQYPKPVWELVSTSNSAPVKLINYGVPIRGMHPKSPSDRPDPLVPGTPYLLVLKSPDSGAITHPFTATARNP